MDSGSMWTGTCYAYLRCTISTELSTGCIPNILVFYHFHNHNRDTAVYIPSKLRLILLKYILLFWQFVSAVSFQLPLNEVTVVSITLMFLLHTQQTTWC